jgi:hypothetical protein
VSAILHWHATSHALICIGGAVVWLLVRLMEFGGVPVGGQSDIARRMEAERRGRERIKEDYDNYDRREDA